MAFGKACLGVAAGRWPPCGDESRNANI